MYHRYESQCFVLSSYPEKEANRSYVIFSRDLGLISAKAQGVALSASKLRGNLEAPSKVSLSLVKGKEVWRIVGVQAENNLWLDLKSNREGLALFTRLANLVKRMVQGEERHEELFLVLEECALALQEKVTKEDLLALELVLVSKLLHHLGYFKLKEEYEEFFNKTLSEIDSKKILSMRRYLVADINRALKESHL